MFTEARSILRSTSVQVHSDEFTIISFDRETWLKILEDRPLSPDGSSPFMLISDPDEITLILNRPDFERIRPGIRGAECRSGYRLVTFSAKLDLGLVGFMAEVSRILAEASVPILALSSFSRDHLLIKQDGLAAALKALGPHVAELC